MELGHVVLVHACERILKQVALLVTRVLLRPLDDARKTFGALVEPRDILLDVTEPCKAAFDVVGTDLACLESYNSDLFILCEINGSNCVAGLSHTFG